MKTIAASILALGLFAGIANAKSPQDVFTDLNSTAPSSPYGSLQDTAPRSPFQTMVFTT